MRIDRNRKLAFLVATGIALLTPAWPVLAQPLTADMTPAPAHWTVNAVQDLIAAIEESRDEGLHPADYGAAALKRAVAAGENGALDALATASALSLAHDYCFGRMSDRSDMQWLIQRSPYEAGQLPARLQSAIDGGKLRDFFQALLP